MNSDDAASLDANEDPPLEPITGPLSFENLDPTEFEEFCYDLLVRLGFVNVDWRKGTNKKASPSDRGRGIVAQLERTDIDGHRYFETWFVDCKHYKRGAPPESFQGLFTWAEAERPITALVLASGFLSNPAKDWIASYQSNRNSPFRIRHWERPSLERIIAKHPDLMTRYGVIRQPMRSTVEILKAENEFFDKIWYVRKIILQENVQEGEGEPIPPELQARMEAGMRAVEERYGKDNVGPWDDWGWGFVHGKISALRWVLGVAGKDIVDVGEAVP
ncbi:restriction endonuclease [Streptomyces calidiresistens]|uniref:Restriction endonuclease n=1 Tax=Streptomyces calidiresistens TaxID=1485586 RepID=A0A7W3T004_9ACTN|nr:restriction endonuclease [Streptomyces calidiresistens]MBB0228392.1 restriction endonuclease [Streptomyces calidiresistens]